MKLCTTTSDVFQVLYPFNFSLEIVSGKNLVFFSSRFRRRTKFLPSIGSSIDKPKRNSINILRRRNQFKNYAATENGRAEREVECEVEVISWQERRIKAELLVNADVQSVWKALTDYEKLADFIPNLVSSRIIPCPQPGHIWLEQIGLQRALYWHIEARVVLDLQEFQISENHLEVQFVKVEGDFKKFEGKWSVKSGISYRGVGFGYPIDDKFSNLKETVLPYAVSLQRATTSSLSYEVNVIPAFNFPAVFLEGIIKSQLPVNLLAVACRSEVQFDESRNMVD